MILSEANCDNELVRGRQTTISNALLRDKNPDNGACFDGKTIEIERKGDIKMLCNTTSNLNEVIHPEESTFEKFVVRQIVDKNLPIFDGKEEWPFFNEQFGRITKICGYN